MSDVKIRLANASRFDRIVVMDGGRVAEEGAPSELLRRGGLFANMMRSDSP